MEFTCRLGVCARGAEDGALAGAVVLVRRGPRRDVVYAHRLRVVNSKESPVIVIVREFYQLS